MNRIRITFYLLSSLLLSFLMFACQTDEEIKTSKSGFNEKKKEVGKAPSFVMDYYDGAYSIYNYCGAPFVHPDTIAQRIVGKDRDYPVRGSHKVLATVEHKALIDFFIKDWEFSYHSDDFGVFDDSLTAVFQLKGTKAFANKMAHEQRLKEVGANVPVHYSSVPGFRSVQLLNPPVSMHAYLLCFSGKDLNDDKDKFYEIEVTNEAYLVTFDPRVAIARGGLGEKGPNLKLVRRKLTEMTAEDFRWLNADFFIDVPAKDKGRFYGMKLSIVRADGATIEGKVGYTINTSLPIGEITYPELEGTPREPFAHLSSTSWFLYHNRQPKK